MKSVKRILWGVILVILGIIWVLKVCDVITFELFFDGWWTLFIIVPCLVGLVTEREKFGNLLGLLIGVCLFLACRNIVTFDLLWRLFIPVIVILVGCRLIFGNLWNHKKEQARKIAEEKLSERGGELVEHCAVFSGLDLNFDGQSFYGAEFTAVFGGIKCDLRNAIIEDDAVIHVSAIFGGIDILLPENVKLNITVSQIFGGVTNKRSTKPSENAPTLHVGGYCVFGGTDLK